MRNGFFTREYDDNMEEEHEGKIQRERDKLIQRKRAGEEKPSSKKMLIQEISCSYHW